MSRRLLLAALVMIGSAASAQSPAPRSVAALVRDPFDGSLLMYGGHAVMGAPPDSHAVVWRWSSGRWQQMAPRGHEHPGVRSDMIAVFDSSSRRLLVVGGQVGRTAFGDVWMWQRNQWTRVTGDGPRGRHLASGAFDPVRGELLLMGGHDVQADEMQHDTWIFGPNGWRIGDSTRTLGTRFASGMAWDPHRGKVVLHGGHTLEGGEQHDTWEWDGSAWHRISTEGPVVPAHNALVQDPLGRGLLLISSPGDPVLGPMETWLFEGTEWRRLTLGGPSPRGGHALVHDPNGGRVILFGGQADSRNKFNDMWQFDGEKWSPMHR